MYKFTTLNGAAKRGSPAEAFYIDGRSLDTIKGLRTIAVQGREAVEREIHQSASIAGRDGVFVFGANFKPRTLRVFYEIAAKTQKEWMEAYHQLHFILFPTEGDTVRRVMFADDGRSYYYAVCTSLTPVAPGELATTGEFSLLLADPFKYFPEEPLQFEGVNTMFPAATGTDRLLPVKLAKITITPRENSQKLIFRNNINGYQLVVDNVNGEAVVFDFAKRTVKKRDGTPAALDFVVSDFPDFVLRGGDALSTNVRAAVEIVYERRAL